MTAAEYPPGPHPWLASSTVRRASDVVLGCVVLVAGAAAIWDGRGTAFGRWDQLDARFFPTVVGGLLVAAAVVLFARGAFLGRVPVLRWSLGGFAILVAAIGAVFLAAWLWGEGLLLRFGPPEFAALIVLILAAAIALARRSRVRAAAMTFLGLLLGAVGLDAITGELRLTMGLEQLIDGVARPVVLLGLIVVADSAVCLISPSLLLASYAWLASRWRNPEVPTPAAMAMRVIAALAIAAACYLAFDLSARAWEVGLLLVLGAFGVACKLFGWNRFVFILAFAYGDQLEVSIRQSMLVSNGDPAIFLRGPISGALMLLAGIVLAAVSLLSVRRILLRRPAEPALS